MSRFSYYVGVDLGQARDYTAIAIIEEPVWVPDDLALRARLGAPPAGWVSPATFAPIHLAEARNIEIHHYGGRPGKPALAVRHLERLPLGTPYPAVVARTAQLFQRSPLLGRSPSLIVDHTGVGRPVVDLFREQFETVAITITGGNAVTRDGHNLGVPKRDLIGAVAVLLEGRRLQIAEELPEAVTLVKELDGFQRRITAAGNDTYEAWREGAHDDLVLAVALAGWYREWWNAHLDAGGRSRQYDRWGRETA